MSSIKNNSYIGYLENSKITVKKRRMKGGTDKIFISENDEYLPYFEIQTTQKIQNFRPSNLVFNSNKYFTGKNGKNDYSLSNSNKTHTIKNESNVKRIFFSFRKDITEDFLKKFLEYNKPNILKKLQELGIQDDVVIDLYIPYISNGNKIPVFKKIKYITEYEIKLNDILSSQEYKNNEKYLNVALRTFGIRESLLYFGDFLSYFDNNLPIISVGSGTAYFEYLIQKIFRREIICIDPAPTVFSLNIRNPTVFIQPKYRTVNGNGKQTLVKSPNYNQMKDCLLILNWSYPMFKINKNYNPYDYEAIIKLKPTGFFIVYETFGGSASQDIRELLDPGWQIESNPEFKISDEETISYKLLNNIDKFIEKKKNTVSNFHYRIAYYKKNKVRNISTLFSNNRFFEE